MHNQLRPINYGINKQGLSGTTQKQGLGHSKENPFGLLQVNSANRTVLFEQSCIKTVHGKSVLHNIYFNHTVALKI
jgi:hypothetical protein